MVRDEEPGNGVSNEVPIAIGRDTQNYDACQWSGKFKKSFENMA